MNPEQQEAQDQVVREQAAALAHQEAITRTQDSVTAANLAQADQLRAGCELVQAKAHFWRSLGAGVLLVAIAMTIAVVTVAFAI